MQTYKQAGAISVGCCGLQLHCETSGTEALKWVAEGKVLPDLILLDCMMPGMSGVVLHSPQSTPPPTPLPNPYPPFPLR